MDLMCHPNTKTISGTTIQMFFGLKIARYFARALLMFEALSASLWVFLNGSDSNLNNGGPFCHLDYFYIYL